MEMCIRDSYSCVCKRNGENTGIRVDASKPEIDVQLLEVNEYSRPGIETNGITGIVIHYTANPDVYKRQLISYYTTIIPVRSCLMIYVPSLQRFWIPMYLL